jgi:hypothetical protein
MNGGRIGVAHGPGLGQLAGGAGFAREHVEHGASARLPAEIPVDKGPAVAEPRRFHRAARAEHHDYVRVCGGRRVQQVDLVLRQRHVRAVEALRFADLVEAEIQQHDLRFFCESGRLGLQRIVRAAVAAEALRTAHAGEAACFHGVLCGVQHRGVHDAGARALIARRQGEIADEGHLRPLRQRQQAALVFEQDDALPRRAAGQRMVRREIKPLRCGFHRAPRGEHERQQFFQPRVHIRFADLAAFDGFHQFPDGISARRGHLQRGAVLHAQRVIVGAAPVRDDGAIEAPRLFEDVAQQVLALVGVGAVDEVVRRHDGLGLPSFTAISKPVR